MEVKSVAQKEIIFLGDMCVCICGHAGQADVIGRRMDLRSVLRSWEGELMRAFFSCLEALTAEYVFSESCNLLHYCCKGRDASEGLALASLGTLACARLCPFSASRTEQNICWVQQD